MAEQEYELKWEEMRERLVPSLKAINALRTSSSEALKEDVVKSAKIAVISDIHSNLQAFEAVLANIKSQGISEIYCCGDIVGYGGNPNECVEIIRDKGIKWVLGNHEVAILNPGYAEKVGFSAPATAVVNWQIKELNQESRDFLNAQNQENYGLEKDDFVIVHGELTKPKDFLYLNKDLYVNSKIYFDNLLSDNFSILKKNNKRICFIGHVHIPEIWTLDADDKIVGGYIKEGIVEITNAKNAIVNVGSVGQPRDGDNRACYVIYDKENGKVEIRYVRVEYNIADAQKAIRDRIPDYEENTANYMAERLSKGR